MYNMCACQVCSDFATPGTVAHWSLLSIGLCRQEYWSGLPFLLQGTFLTQGSNTCLLHWHADSLPLSYLGSPTSKIYTSE